MAIFLLGREGGGGVMDAKISWTLYKQQTFFKKAFHYARKLNPIHKTNTYKTT